MNKYLRLFILGTLIWWFGAGLLGPLYAVFVSDIGGDVLDIAGAHSIYLIIMGSFSIYVGKISDKYSKEKLLISGYFLSAVATFGYLLVDSPTKLFLLQGVLGIAAAIASPNWDSLFSEHLDKKHDGEEWGILEGSYSIIVGISIFIGGLILTSFGFKTLFVIMGSIQLTATIVIFTNFHLKKRLTKSIKNRS